MPSSAIVTVVGHLGRDPEVGTTSGGKTYTKFSIAVSEKGKNGESTTWWNCTAFGKDGEYAAKYLTKGSLAQASGKGAVREYIKKDGNKGFSAEVFCYSVVGLVGKQDGGGKPKVTDEDPADLF